MHIPEGKQNNAVFQLLAYVLALLYRFNAVETDGKWLAHIERVLVKLRKKINIIGTRAPMPVTGDWHRRSAAGTLHLINK